MKKKIIAATLFVVVAGGYTACSWYTGNQITNHIDDELQTLNRTIAQIMPSDQQFKVSYHNYQQGIFSTSLQLELTNSAQGITINEPITIYHGPFPWSNIRSGSFSPKMMSFYYQMNKETSQNLWSLAYNQPFISANLSIVYNLNIILDIDSNPISYIDPRFTIDSAANQLSFSVDNNNRINIALKIKKLTVTQPETEQQIVFEGLNYNGKLVLDDPKSNIDMQLKLNNLTIDDPDNHLMVKNISVQQSNDIVENQMDSTAHIIIPKVQFNKQDLGHGQLDIDADLPLEVVLNSLKGWSQPNIQDNPPTNLNIDKLMWQTSQGALSADMQLSLISGDLDLNELHQDDVLSLQASTNLPIKPLSYLWAQIMNSQQDTINDEDIAIAGSQLIGFYNILRPQLSLLKLNTNHQKQPTGFTADLNYSQLQDNAIINGETINSEEFWSKLGVN